MRFLTPRIAPPPSPPPVPPKPDLGLARVMADEAERTERQRRRGRGSTIVAGALGDKTVQTGGTPTLMS